VNLLPTKADFSQTRISPIKDLMAGLTVAIVALPLALAFGIGSGLGAQSGITTAIIAGALAAVFGGSRLQVSGPTGAMTVVLIPIFSHFGASGVLAVGLMAGVLLVLAGLLRLGQHVHRLPTSLIEGITAGIAIVIALQQFPYIFGLPKSDAEQVWLSAWDVLTAATVQFNWPPVLTALSVASVILLGSRRWPKFPFALVAVLVASVATKAFQLPIDLIGDLPAGIGNLSFEFLNAADWVALIPSAVAVAALAALESLLSAKIADRMRGSGETHDSNRELFGQGVANLVVPFFGGVPATAALARTAVNVKSGANSRLSALAHSATLALVILAIAPLVAQIPLAALAGVLLATTVHMIKPSELRHSMSQSHMDALVLLTSLALMVFVDLISALVVGVALTVALRRTSLNRKLPPVSEEETLGD
jgi:SulP family sulfate permease